MNFYAFVLRARKPVIFSHYGTKKKTILPNSRFCCGTKGTRCCHSARGAREEQSDWYLECMAVLLSFQFCRTHSSLQPLVSGMESLDTEQRRFVQEELTPVLQLQREQRGVEYADSGEKLPLPNYDYDIMTQEPIEIRHGCVFIPIVFAIWWYWTRRAAKRAVRLLITGGEGCFAGQQHGARADIPTSVAASHSSDTLGEEEDVENRVPVRTTYDKFDTWDDVVAQESSSSHLVRWITTSEQKKAKRRMRAVTKAVMNRAVDGKTNQTSHNDSMEYNAPNCEGLLAFDDAFSESNCSNWECIEDTAIEVPTRKSLADDVSQHSGVMA